jgi:hypothetical protein
VTRFLRRLECDNVTFSVTQAVDGLTFCGVQLQKGKQIILSGETQCVNNIISLYKATLLLRDTHEGPC